MMEWDEPFPCAGARKHFIAFRVLDVAVDCRAVEVLPELQSLITCSVGLFMFNLHHLQAATLYSY